MKPDPDQIVMFLTCLLLHCVAPERNMRRFYLMSVQRDLFGGARYEQYPDEGKAVTALSVTAYQKRGRGYKDHADRKDQL